MKDKVFSKKDRIAKEYTEFSADELAQVLVDAAEAPLPPPLTSDDFLSAGLKCSGEEQCDVSRFAIADIETPLFHQLAPQAVEARWRDLAMQLGSTVAPAPMANELCKELTEYSTRELAFLTAGACALDTTKTASSDDFCEESKVNVSTFFTWYDQACLGPSCEPGRCWRRVLQMSRKKTSSTLFEDESSASSSSSASSADPLEAASSDSEAEAEGQAASPAAGQSHAEELNAGASSEPVSECRLLTFLKSNSNPGRQEVLDLAFNEGRLPGGGYNGAAVLKQTDRSGWTPLLTAVHRRQLAAAEALLDLGAEVDETHATSGWTPLMYAAGAGNVPFVELLLLHGARANAVAAKHQWSPLCSAIQAGKPEIVRLLLDAGADLQSLKRAHPAIAESFQEMC